MGSVYRGPENDPRRSNAVEGSAVTVCGFCNLPGYDRSALHGED